MGFRLRPDAVADVDAIAKHIAEHNPRASRRWFAEVNEQFVRLGEMPGRGAPRYGIAPGLRVAPFGNYLIFYREENGDAVVLRVLHGARRWEDLVRGP